MSLMTAYDVYVIYKDKSIIVDTSGPYFGSFLDEKDAVKKSLEYEKNANVFMTQIKKTSIMA